MDELTEVEQIAMERDHLEGIMLNAWFDYLNGKSIHPIMCTFEPTGSVISNA